MTTAASATTPHRPRARAGRASHMLDTITHPIEYMLDNGTHAIVKACWAC